MNFKELKLALEPYTLNFIQELLPGGKLLGREWRTGSIHGGQGDSFGINIDSQAWGDLNAAEGAKGGDLISLYAAIHNIGQIKAAEILADKIGFKRSDDFIERRSAPPCVHQAHGKPSFRHEYTDERGNLLAVVARYEYQQDGENKKEFRQFSFDFDEKKWIAKGLKNNCPLYRLRDISNNPNARILIVEGEKTAEAAQRLIGNKAIVTTWMGGSSAVKKTNWTPLTNRDIVIWPDNDEAGIKAANDIAVTLIGIANTLKIYEVDKLPDLPKKFDAADAEKLGHNTAALFKSLTSVQRIFKPNAVAIVGSNIRPQDSLIGKVEKIDPSIDTISINVDNSIDKFSQVSFREKWETLGLQMNASGNQPVANAYNVYLILKRHPKYAGKFFEDSFKGKRYYNGEDFRDYIISDILIDMQGGFGLAKITKSAIIESVDKIYSDNRRNLFLEYLNGITWDGESRIDRFFVDCFGAHDTSYSEAVSKNFWIAMVKRATNPGIKFDNMVILEGAQGLRKSSSLKLIAGEYYYSIGEDPKNKDFFDNMRGTLIVEVEELDSFRKSEATTLKRILSTEVDQLRVPYGRSKEAFPRTSIFVGTTNKLDYLSDSTGNRRYWPIQCTSIKFDYIKENRDQFFAEAYVRAKADECYWEVPTEFLEEIYDKRMNENAVDDAASDPWFDRVYGATIGKSEVDIAEILINDLNFLYNQVKRQDRNRVAKILKHVGFKNINTKINGIQKRTWKKQNESIQNE